MSKRPGESSNMHYITKPDKNAMILKPHQKLETGHFPKEFPSVIKVHSKEYIQP